jgi:hypothetical protein
MQRFPYTEIAVADVITARGQTHNTYGGEIA